MNKGDIDIELDREIGVNRKRRYMWMYRQKDKDKVIVKEKVKDKERLIVDAMLCEGVKAQRYCCVQGNPHTKANSRCQSKTQL